MSSSRGRSEGSSSLAFEKSVDLELERKQGPHHDQPACASANASASTARASVTLRVSESASLACSPFLSQSELPHDATCSVAASCPPLACPATGPGPSTWSTPPESRRRGRTPGKAKAPSPPA
eukprot:CAMPEP_0181333230 /NCGR_PEP_ID=MMETSP1101-20121128/25550_1 /TAXON_ID=46948 /ORGANISM="Rhodomonas abbreviata, Strain Caron Lab Isolate" /LENGTH=122 /DNA_ID=CAMNT_0023442995 /DNA_START=211 /DNA_END=577 /DNA_ORIENTATION=-